MLSILSKLIKGYFKKNLYGDYSMIEVVLLSLLLSLTQFWIIPVCLNLKHIKYLLSNRDSNNIELSEVSKRVLRASDNLKESLPIFLAICILSIILDKENTLLASYWLILRIGHLLIYSFGITFLNIRSIFWLGSILCLILMAVTILN